VLASTQVARRLLSGTKKRRWHNRHHHRAWHRRPQPDPRCLLQLVTWLAVAIAAVARF
jgi:hypothetical protein